MKHYDSLDALDELPPEEAPKPAQAETEQAEKPAPQKPAQDKAPAPEQAEPTEQTEQAEQAEPAEPEGAEGEEKAPATPKLTDDTEIEVDGSKVKLEQLKRAWQKSAGADRKLREAAQMRQDASWALDSVGDPKGDPFNVLTQIYSIKLGSRTAARELVFQKVNAYLHNSGVLDGVLGTEQQRRDYELRMALEDRDLELNQVRAKEEKARLERELEQFAENYIRSVQTAIKTAGLPPTKQVEALVARKIRETSEAEGIDLTVDQAVNIVKLEIEEELERRAAAGIDYEFVKTRNPALLEKLRKEDIGRLKAGAQTTSRAAASQNNGSTQAKRRTYQTPDEFFER